MWFFSPKCVHTARGNTNVCKWNHCYCIIRAVRGTRSAGGCRAVAATVPSSFPGQQDFPCSTQRALNNFNKNSFLDRNITYRIETVHHHVMELQMLKCVFLHLEFWKFHIIKAWISSWHGSCFFFPWTITNLKQLECSLYFFPLNSKICVSHHLESVPLPLTLPQRRGNSLPSEGFKTKGRSTTEKRNWRRDAGVVGDTAHLWSTRFNCRQGSCLTAGSISGPER